MRRRAFLSLAAGAADSPAEVRLAMRGGYKLPMRHGSVAGIPIQASGRGYFLCWWQPGGFVYLADKRDLKAHAIALPEESFSMPFLREDGMVFFILVVGGDPWEPRTVIAGYDRHGIERESFPSPLPGARHVAFAGREVLVWNHRRLHRGAARGSASIGASREPQCLYLIEEVAPGVTWLLNRMTGEVRTVDWKTRRVTKRRLPKDCFPRREVNSFLRFPSATGLASDEHGRAYVLLDSKVSGLEGSLVLECDADGAVKRRLRLAPQEGVRIRARPSGLLLIAEELFVVLPSGDLVRYPLPPSS
jgi:hypothetical protein